MDTCKGIYFESPRQVLFFSSSQLDQPRLTNRYKLQMLNYKFNLLNFTLSDFHRNFITLLALKFFNSSVNLCRIPSKPQWTIILVVSLFTMFLFI